MVEKPLRITSIVKMSTNIGSVILTGTKKTGKQTLFFSLTYFLNDFPWRDFASTETIDTSALASKKERLDNLDQANAEIEKLRKLGEKLTGELQGNVAFLFFSYEKKKSKSSFYLTQSCGLFIPEAQCVSIIKLLPLSIIYFHKKIEKKITTNFVNFWYEVHEIWKKKKKTRIILM